MASPRPLRALLRVLAVLVAAGIVLAPAISSATRSGEDPARERERVRAKAAQVASQVDALRASDEEVRAALADLQANVAGQEALLAEAERAAAAAQEAHREAIEAVEAKTAEIEELQDKVREFAIEAFIRPPEEDAMAALDADSPTDAAEKRALLALQNERDSDLLDQLAAAQEDLEVQRQLAEEAAVRAEETRQDVQNRLTEVTKARDQQAAFAAEVEARLDRALAESAALADLDKELSEQIRKQQEELARQAELERIAALARQRQAATPAVTRVGGSVSLSSVSCPSGGSITVASSIASNLSRLLQAAASDGIMLCGGGYRSSESQVALRRAHCGSSNYDIYQKPSSQCRPPTAPPGSSMHERGLAVDFTCNGGGAISSRSSPCFQWLSSNAGSYGFYNLPSEPWHWSTNGQ